MTVWARQKLVLLLSTLVLVMAVSMIIVLVVAVRDGVRSELWNPRFLDGHGGFDRPGGGADVEAALMATRTTELAAGAQHAGFWRTPGPARLALGLVLTILLLKLPTVTIALLLPEGYGTLVPASGGGKEVWISLSWIVFTLVAVGARHWIGAVSAIWLLTLSAISGGRLLADSYLAWGLWLMASSLVGLMALALALRAGGFSRKRRSADGR